MSGERCGAPCDFKMAFRCNLPAGHSEERGHTSCTWRVFTLKDAGPNQWYRYNITGEVLDADRPPRPFSWTVPDLDDPKFDLSGLVNTPV